MPTANEFIEDALNMIGVHASETAIEPYEMQIAIRTLNDFMSEIDESGIAFGFVPLQSETDEVRMRRGAVKAVKANLAGLLTVPFKKSITPGLAAVIKSSNASLLRMTVKFGRVKVAGTLPRGSGNKGQLLDEKFFPDQDKANF